jgi:hypothetical protein
MANDSPVVVGLFRQQARLRSVEERFTADSLSHGGGGGTSGGVTDDWKASVDAQLKHLREDIQQVRNWIVVGIAGPLLAVIGLYAYTGNKFDAAEARTVGVEARLSALAVEQAKMDAKLSVLLERSSPRKR